MSDVRKDSPLKYVSLVGFDMYSSPFSTILAIPMRFVSSCRIHPHRPAQVHPRATARHHPIHAHNLLYLLSPHLLLCLVHLLAICRVHSLVECRPYSPPNSFNCACEYEPTQTPMRTRRMHNRRMKSKLPIHR